MRKLCLRAACCGVMLLMSGCAWPWLFSSAKVDEPAVKAEEPAIKAEALVAKAETPAAKKVEQAPAVRTPQTVTAQPAQTAPPVQPAPSIQIAQPGQAAPPAQSTQAVRSVPEKAVELLSLAKKLWIGEYCSDPEKATAMLDAALEFAPDYAEAYLWRGRALGDLGYLADAFDDFTRSIQLHPSAMAYAGRGLTGLRMGNAEGAEQDLTRALELDDQEPLAYVYRAAQLFLQGQDSKACADLAAACKYGMCEPEQNAHRDKLCR